LFEHDLFGKPDSTFPDHALAFGQQGCDIRADRHAAGAADAGAFEAGDRGTETQGFGLSRAFGERQRKSAVQRIAGAERIHG
jgi:hypothetical protein